MLLTRKKYCVTSQSYIEDFSIEELRISGCKTEMVAILRRYYWFALTCYNIYNLQYMFLSEKNTIIRVRNTQDQSEYY